MKKTKHEKFLQELRAPVLNLENVQHSRKASKSLKTRFSSAKTSHEYADITAQLEAKFEELFGSEDDDDDDD